MNTRTLKKHNKKTINNILNKIPFTITRKSFGSAYFIFKFEENSICWFWLKEFPLYKFGIWLNKDNSYSVFGEAICLIDKFKPSASTISETNIISFNKELFLIHNKDISYKEYFRDIKYRLADEKRINKYNKDVLNSLISFIKDFNKKYENKMELKFKKYNKYESSTIDLFINENYKLSNNDLINIYNDLCQNIYYNKRLYSDFYTINYSFSGVNEIIVNPNEYNKNALNYKWKKLKSFNQKIRMLKLKENLFNLRKKKC